MSKLSKAILVASLFSVPLFAANASSGDPVGPERTAAEIVKMMGGKGEAIYYTTVTGQDTLKVVYPDSGSNWDAKIKPGYIELTKVDGIYEFPRDVSIPFVPYKIVNIDGYFPDPTEMEKAAHKIAADHKAYAYHINSVTENTKGNNNLLQVALYKENAPLNYQSAIYYVYDHKTVRELTLASAHMMKPMGMFEFEGTYPLYYDITAAAAKHAAAKGASAFFITSIAENTDGTRKTVYVNYYE